MNKLVYVALFSTLLISQYYLYTQNNAQSLEMQSQDEVIMEAYKIWLQKQGKQSNGIDSYRFSIFRESFLKVEAHKLQNKSYTIGLNKFADMSDEEFNSTMLMKNNEVLHGENISYKNGEQKIISNVDWRKKGAVTPVQNQGACGSCYTFATAAALEGSAALQSPLGLQKFSEQQLVSCSQDFGNDGCDGGWGSGSMEYVIQNGISYEADYPYVSGEGEVPACESFEPAYFIQSYRNVVGRGSCTAIQKQVAQQPVYGRVNTDNWKLYTGGIFDDCNTDPDTIGHAITIIGFDTEPTKEENQYWLIKNSWGEDWGENGFIRLTYGNSCSVCYECFAPQF